MRSVHLSIVADDVWLWVLLRDRQGKHRGNKYCVGTVVAEGQRNALPWVDVTLSTSYKQFVMNGLPVEHLLWTSVGLQAQNISVSRPMCNCLFLCCDVYYHLSQYWALLFLAIMNKCIKLRKYAFPEPCLLYFFYFLSWWVLLPLKIFNTFLTPCILGGTFVRCTIWQFFYHFIFVYAYLFLYILRATAGYIRWDHRRNGRCSARATARISCTFYK